MHNSRAPTSGSKNILYVGCLIFVCPQYGTCFKSSLRRLALGVDIFKYLCIHVIYCLSFNNKSSLELPATFLRLTTIHQSYTFLFLFWPDSPHWARASSFTRFLYHTQRRTTFSRTPLDECSARRRDLHLKTHNIHNRQTSMSPFRFEPTISAEEWPQT